MGFEWLKSGDDEDVRESGVRHVREKSLLSCGASLKTKYGVKILFFHISKFYLIR